MRRSARISGIVLVLLALFSNPSFANPSLPPPATPSSGLDIPAAAPLYRVFIPMLSRGVAPAAPPTKVAPTATNVWPTATRVPATATPTGSVVLNVPTYKQICDQWCWDGVSQMVLAYYGTLVSQPIIANYAWGRSDCGTGSFCNGSCNQPNYISGGSGSVQGILAHWGVSSTYLGDYLSYSTVKSQLQAHDPIIIRIGWYSGGGHFWLLRGYDDASASLTYNDPWDGSQHIATYSWVLHAAYDHDWTHTLYNVHR